MFNKVKQKLLKKNKVIGYLKYAIGEIILIVVGIMIAVSINNWNEEKQKKEIRNSIFAIIEKDLKSDITEAKRLIGLYEGQRPFYMKIMNDTLSKEEIVNCKEYVTMLETQAFFSINTRGVSQLNDFKDLKFDSKDMLVFNIIDFYSNMSKRIELTNDWIEDDTNDNFTYWRNEYPWYGKMILTREWNDQAIEYYRKSPEYKNKVAYRSRIIYNNYIPILENFIRQSTIILKQLNEKTGYN